MSLNRILDRASLYHLFQYVIGSVNFQNEYIKAYICPKAKDKILDLGCGTADVLRYLEDVEYFGVDMNPRYIGRARKVFKDKGTFLCSNIDRSLINKLGVFDTVCAIGVLHHLNDDEAKQLLRVAFAVLKPGGRFITIDTCYVAGQSKIARFLISKDRGKYVRTQEGYEGLVNEFFPCLKAHIRNDFYRIPVSSCVLECSTPLK